MPAPPPLVASSRCTATSMQEAVDTQAVTVGPGRGTRLTHTTTPGTSRSGTPALKREPSTHKGESRLCSRAFPPSPHRREGGSPGHLHDGDYDRRSGRDASPAGGMEAEEAEDGGTTDGWRGCESAGLDSRRRPPHRRGLVAWQKGRSDARIRRSADVTGCGAECQRPHTVNGTQTMRKLWARRFCSKTSRQIEVLKCSKTE
ncbi:unnamed protein product [Boreogadus saida]